MGFNAIIGCVFFHSPLPVSHRRSAGALFGVVAAFLLLTGCQSADPTKKPDSPTSQVVVACINTSEADLRFNDVDELVSAHSYSAARSILEVLLTDCAEKVRNKALDSLKRLDPPETQPRPVTPHQAGTDIGGDKGLDNCPGMAVWEQRFEYADDLWGAREFAGARAILESALDDCSQDVRKKAVSELNRLPLPPPSSEFPLCPDASIWQQRFDYADDLKKHDLIDAARIELGLMVDACNEAVRKQALSGLVALPARPPVATTSCAEYGIWEPRLIYGNRLKKSGNVAGSQAVLAPALADCDVAVRKMALSLLLHRPPLLSRRLAAVGSYIGETLAAGGDIAFKGGLGIVLAVLLYFLIVALRDAWDRTRLATNALEVSGTGINGSQFIDILSDNYYQLHELDQLQQENAELLRVGEAVPNISVTAPRMLLATTGEAVDPISDAAEAISGDSAGKLAAIFLKLIRQPCYISSGSVIIGARRTYIVVRLERRGQIIGRWDCSSTPSRLISDLQTCALYILQTTSDDIAKLHRQ
jgi:hypothetical protein